MAEHSTFIKIDRNIMRWRWWHDHNTLIVFLYLLLSANIQEKPFERDIVRRGEVATSISTIAQQTKLTPQNVRTAINHLKSTGEITIKSTNRYQVISIVNYDLYQNKPTNKLTFNQQTPNKQLTNKLTTTKEYIKNKKNGKKERIPPNPPKGENPPSEIPEMYRDMFKTVEEYLAWRNQ